MRVELLEKCDTIYCADSIEWCPIAKYHQIFVCGNYQLLDDTSNGTADVPRERVGRVLLFKYCNKVELIQQIDTEAILDQKWCFHTLNNKPVLAVTTTKGTLLLYTLEICDTSKEALVTWVSYLFEPAEKERLLLSVDWSTGKYNAESPQLVVSDNLGNVHLFQLCDNALKLLNTWSLHSHEAWICAFDYWHPSTIFSGGDDLLFIKTNTQSSQHIKNCSHECGVTSVHSNTSREHIITTGSYDTYVRFWDMRNIKLPLSSIQTSGPVWRLKWDPFKQEQLMAVCMDGGVSIINALNPSDPQTVGNFTEHSSIVYGGDWCHAPNSNLISTCSFYDHLMCISKIKHEI